MEWIFTTQTTNARVMEVSFFTRNNWDTKTSERTQHIHIHIYAYKRIDDLPSVRSKTYDNTIESRGNFSFFNLWIQSWQYSRSITPTYFTFIHAWLSCKSVWISENTSNTSPNLMIKTTIFQKVSSEPKIGAGN